MKRKIESIPTRTRVVIGMLAALLSLAATGASSTTVYVPTAPAYVPAPGAEPPNANASPTIVPALGVVVDDHGVPLPRCRESSAEGVTILRGTGCVP